MSEEILINVTPQETRAAVVENGVLQEVHIERLRSRGIVGNVYRGTVTRVLPGMQAAFVDIGLERSAFLHASDVRSAHAHEHGREQQGEGGETAIARLLQDGEEITVQVVKDPVGGKGARVTTHLAFPARYLVYLPHSHHIGISQRIEDESERERLRAALKAALPPDGAGGYILRTLAGAVTDEEIRIDAGYLRRVWEAVQERSREASGAKLIHEDLPLALRTMRDLVRQQVVTVRIDSRETYQKAQAFAAEFMPEMAGRIEYYPGERPIFDLYGVEDELKRALMRRVSLKSGGYLVIDQTEAMTTIDVNTGGYVGRHSLEDTLFKTNLEATQTIARQIRLRNLGGMIIVDFIDMKEPEHKRQVLRALERSLVRDRARTFLTGMTNLGLVEITRKRARESLSQQLCEPCPVCEGRGTLKTARTVCYELFREILRQARAFGVEKYLVLASRQVVDLLLDEEAEGLARLQEFIGRPVELKVDTSFSQEQYEVFLM